jgi:hypothetical protein
MTLTRVGWRVFALVLAVLQARSFAAPQVAPSPPSSPAAQKIKDQVNALPIGGKLTVRKLDGTEYHGHLQAIDRQSFSVREVDLKQTVAISYGDVDRIRKDYGRKGFGGRRVDPKRSLVIGAIFIGALLTVVFVLVAQDKS